MKKSPLLLASIEDYFLGGTTAITEEIRRCAFYFNSWFTETIPEDSWSLCDTFYGRNPRRQSHDKYPTPISSKFDMYSDIPTFEIEHFKVSKNHNVFISTHALSMFGTSIVVGKFFGHDTGDMIAISAPYEFYDHQYQFQPDTGAIYLVKLSDLLNPSLVQNMLLPATKIEMANKSFDIADRPSLNHVYPFGSITKRITLLRQEMLVVAHPGSSSVKLYSKGSLVLELYWRDATNFFGATGTKLVGETLTVADMDSDGIEDLAVGCPKCDYDNISQRGKVFFFKGADLEDAIKNGMGEIKENEEWEAPKVAAEDLMERVIQSPTTQKGYELFGSQLGNTHLKDELQPVSYLLVTSAGMGCVYIYDLRFKDETPLQIVTVGIMSDFPRISGPSFLGGLKGGWIFIGSSTEKTGSICTQCGRVYVYRATVSGGILDVRLTLILEPFMKGPSLPFERFGSYGTISRSKLYISSPFAGKGRGKVWKVKLKDIHRWSAPVQSLKSRFHGKLKSSDRPEVPIVRIKPMIKGSHKYGRFGASLAIYELPTSAKKELLFVGEPYHGGDKFTDTSNQLMGLVNMYRIKNRDN